MLRKRNLYIARSLALVAVFFIIAFQVFWLNQVYVNKKEEKIKDAEQLLAEKILESERNKIAGTVTLSDKNSSVSANVHDVIKNLNTASTKELNNAVTTSSLKKLQDSKITDASFMVHLPMNTTDPAKDCKTVYDLLRQNSFFSNGNVPFYLMYSFHNTQYIYPAKKDGYTDNTAPVFAHLAPLSFYKIMFPGLFTAILKSMASSFIVSLIYTLLSVSAVLLLLYNLTRTQKLMDMKNSFTHNMTHELKTPVATLYSATEALITYNAIDDKDAAKKYILLMSNDLKRLSNTIDNILTSVRLQHKKAKLHFVSINLLAFLNTVKEDVALKLTTSGAILDIDNVHGNTTICGDNTFLKTVFINLVDNSIKYCLKKPIISIWTEETAKEIKIWFSDNGMGIPRQYQKEIFEPYFRVPEADLHRVKGYGLGLSYAREIVLQHNGSISINSSDEQGTTFLIVLPKTRA